MNDLQIVRVTIQPPEEFVLLENNELTKEWLGRTIIDNNDNYWVQPGSDFYSECLEK